MLITQRYNFAVSLAINLAIDFCLSLPRTAISGLAIGRGVRKHRKARYLCGDTPDGGPR